MAAKAPTCLYRAGCRHAFGRSQEQTKGSGQCGDHACFVKMRELLDSNKDLIKIEQLERKLGHVDASSRLSLKLSGSL